LTVLVLRVVPVFVVVPLFAVVPTFEAPVFVVTPVFEVPVLVVPAFPVEGGTGPGSLCPGAFASVSLRITESPVAWRRGGSGMGPIRVAVVDSARVTARTCAMAARCSSQE
jgi:hypothetical protein